MQSGPMPDRAGICLACDTCTVVAHAKAQLLGFELCHPIVDAQGMLMDVSALAINPCAVIDIWPPARQSGRDAAIRLGIARLACIKRRRLKVSNKNIGDLFTCGLLVLDFVLDGHCLLQFVSAHNESSAIFGFDNMPFQSRILDDVWWRFGLGLFCRRRRGQRSWCCQNNLRGQGSHRLRCSMSMRGQILCLELVHNCEVLHTQQDIDNHTHGYNAPQQMDMSTTAQAF
mmetsp:Transcript_21667/g.50653  ORF Transcript_21667/g.50653 Transcript_21667/m.50653 type:complete len:229 (-) Transcript_21667:171-857(-)